MQGGEGIDDTEWLPPCDEAFSQERLQRIGAIVYPGDRGGVEIRARRSFNEPLVWYARNGHIEAVQKRAGTRLYTLWFLGSMRSRYAISRYSIIPTGIIESEDLELCQQRYIEAKKAIRGVKEQHIVFKVCCMGEPAGRIGHGRQGRESGLVYLRSALDDLVQHFGYEKSR